MPSARARRCLGARCARAAVGYLGSQEGDSAQRSCLAGGAATGGFYYGRVRGLKTRERWCGLSVLAMSMLSLLAGGLFFRL
jgi:hypothetical protein